MMHVTPETRTVYRSIRGCKLTKHAAYVAAAKALIAARCLKESKEHYHPDDERDGIAPVVCDKNGPTHCRFHTLYESRNVGYDEEGGGMEYYVKVLPRLVRFLKFVDAK